MGIPTSHLARLVGKNGICVGARDFRALDFTEQRKGFQFHLHFELFRIIEPCHTADSFQNGIPARPMRHESFAGLLFTPSKECYLVALGGLVWEA